MKTRKKGPLEIQVWQGYDGGWNWQVVDTVGMILFTYPSGRVNSEKEAWAEASKVADKYVRPKPKLW